MWHRTNRRVALLLTEPIKGSPYADLVIDLAVGASNPSRQLSLPDNDGMTAERLQRIGSNLYAALRLCDSERMGIILVQGVEAQGLGEAIMNRLSKAARDIIFLP